MPAKPKIHFMEASLQHKKELFQWLEEPHVKEFWDTSENHRRDLLIFMNGRKEPSPYFGGIFDYWVGLIEEEPYSLIMSSEILSTEEGLQPLWKEHLSREGKTFGIDFMIGNPHYFGKGLAAPTLEAFALFMKEQVDPSADTFFIDPEEANSRAKHVYEKAGFRSVGSFRRDFLDRKSVKHFLMVKTV